MKLLVVVFFLFFFCLFICLFKRKTKKCDVLKLLFNGDASVFLLPGWNFENRGLIVLQDS